MSRTVKGKFPKNSFEIGITLPLAYAQALGEIKLQTGEGASMIIRHMIDDYLTHARGRMGRINGETFTDPVELFIAGVEQGKATLKAGFEARLARERAERQCPNSEGDGR